MIYKYFVLSNSYILYYLGGTAEIHEQTDSSVIPYTGSGTSAIPQTSSVSIIPRKAPAMPKPKWHAPWKLYRVISGHLGWVRCVTVEPGNEWFATGSADRVIKVSLILFSN